MAVARLDTAVSTQVVASGTLAYTVGAGSDRALIVTLANETNGNTTHDSMLYGDQSMVKVIDTATGTSGFTQRTSIWILLDAEIDAASSNVIDPTFGGTQPADLQIHAASYTGVDQTGGATTYPDTNGASATASTPNPLVSDITGVADGAVVAARGCGNNTTFTWQADLTEQTDQSDASSSSSFADALTTGAGNVNVDGTAASQNRGAQSAAALAPASADLDITVPVGNIDTDGLAPSAEIEHNRAVPVGNVDTAGLLPGIAITIGVPVGALTIDTSGTVPSAEITHIRQMPAATELTLDPLVPSAEIIHIRGPPVGSLSLTGLTPTIDVDSGSFAIDVPKTELHLVTFIGLYLNGQAPTIVVEQQSVTSQPGAGSLLLTGLTPSVGRDHIRQVPVATLTFEGLTPSAEIASIRQVPVGSLVFTGLTPQLQEVHVSEMPVGSLVLAGQDPVADTGDNKVAQPPKGTLALTGLVPTAEIVHTRTVPAGSLVLTGLTPSAEEIHNRVVPAGSLTLTGQDPVTLSGDSKVAQPGVGVLSLTGLVPTAIVSVNVVAPTAGSLSLAGKTAALEIIINDADSSLILTGHIPQVDQNESPPPVSRGPLTGTLTLTGQAPIRPAGLLLTGFAPSITGADTLLEIPAGSLSINGYDVTLSVGAGNEPPDGTLSLTGLQPRIEPPQFGDPGTGTLILTGLVPVLDVSMAGEEEGEQPSGGHGWRNQYDAQVQRRRVGRRKRRRRRRDIEAISDKVDREIARHFRKDTERAERDQEVAAMLDIVKVGLDYELFAALDETLGEYYLRAQQKGTFSAVEAFERKLEEIIEEEEFLLLALLSL